MKHKNLILIVAFFLCLPLITAHAATSVSFSPPQSDWMLGEQVAIDVLLTTDESELFSMGLNFFYDPSELDYASFSLDPGIASITFLPDLPVEGPDGSIIGLGLFTPLSYTTGTIGTLFFDTITIGEDFEITASEFSDLGGFRIGTPSGPVGIDPTFENASIDVNAVPIPPTILLLGGGLVSLIGLRRRRSQK